MPIHLNFAPTADLLLPTLAQGLRSHWRDPFASPAVLVPNPALGRWLQLRLTDGERGMGCVMGLRRETLERFLRQSLVRGVPDPQRPKVLDAATLAQVLIPLLENRDLPEVVQRYLRNPKGGVDVARRVQLAMRLATMFQEYEFNRPSVWDPAGERWRVEGMDKVWMRHQPYFCSEVDPTEEWQRTLYCRARDLLDAEYASLPVLYAKRREGSLCPQEPWQVEPGPIFLFQVAKISHFHRNIFIEISQMPGVHLHVYLTNPCAEFWEDVGHRNTRRRWTSRDAAPQQGIAPRRAEDYQKEALDKVVDLPADQPLLQLWGETGKENIFLWCPAADWDFAYRADEVAAPQTLLQAVQYALLHREGTLPPGPGAKWKPDSSLQILLAPDPVREVEELLHNMRALLAQDRELRLEDMVVYLPDPAAYLSAIEGVFGATAPWDPGHIAYNLLGLPGSDSLFAQGMQALLDIAQGSFDRATVFRFLRNPLVQAGLVVEASEVAVWEQWAQNLGVFRGYDRKHRAALGDQGSYTTDEHTFAQGLARLLLGSLAAEPVDLGMTLPVPPYRDLQTGDSDLVAGFCAAVRRLYSQTQMSLSTQNTPVEWVMWWRDLVAAWFPEISANLGPRRAAEVRVHTEFLEALQCMAVQQHPGGRAQFTYEESLVLVRNLLPEELPASSRAWVGGVTFAPLRQGLVVPHKHVFVLGLGAQTFPGDKKDAPFDLLRRKRLVGDADAVRGNRFTFLELLHAARHSLVLSYRARNMQKEEELQPSSVLLELEHWLQPQLCADTSIRTPIAWIDHRNTALEALAHEPRHGLRYVPPPGRPREASPQQVSKLSPWHIRKFLENPLEYHLRTSLGLSDEPVQDTMNAVDEPLSLNALQSSVLCRQVWVHLLERVFAKMPQNVCCDAAQLEVEAIQELHTKYNELCMQGAAPEAQMSAMALQRLEKVVVGYVATSLELVGKLEDYVLVRDGESSLELSLPGANPLSVVVPVRHALLLVHRQNPGDNPVWMVEIAKEKSLPLRLWLSGVLQGLLARSAQNPGVSQEVRALVLNRTEATAGEYTFKDSRDPVWEQVQQWFGHLLQAMLVQGETRHLPLAEVKKIYDSAAKKGADPWVSLSAEALEECRGGDLPVYNAYLPAFALVDTSEPSLQDPKELQRLAKQLFAPYLEGWVLA